MSKLLKCSVEFMDAVCDSGGIVKDCSLCGRVHFSIQLCDKGSYDENELKELLKKQIAEPAKYISHDSSISYGWVANQQVFWLSGWEI